VEIRDQKIPLMFQNKVEMVVDFLDANLTKKRFLCTDLNGKRDNLIFCLMVGQEALKNFNF